MSTSTSDIEPDPDDEGERRRAGGSGRETEDEMRQRILKELEDERKALEQELRELKEKSEVQALPGKLALRLVLAPQAHARPVCRAKAGNLRRARLYVIPRVQ
jgi:hypothetical protein